MQEAILYIAAALSLGTLVLLLVRPFYGVMALFIVRPLVDATWDQPLILDFRLTEIVSTMVPLIIFGRMIFDDGARRPFADMPLKWIWLVYTADCILFSSAVMFGDDWRAGLQVLMRHVNGLAGFYMVQAYCRGEKDFLRFAWAMAIGGFFPMGTGLYENITGNHWRVTFGDGGVVRNIGLYHDAITIRYYAMQTLMSLLLIFALRKRAFAVTAFCLLYGLMSLFVLRGAYSKAASLTVAAWILLWPVLRKSAKGVLGLAVVVFVLAAYYAKEVVDSIGFIFAREAAAVAGSGELQSTFAGRWGIWEDMLKDWQSQGLMTHLFGTGHIANGSHNDYLQVLFHGGWVGLSIYLCLLGAVGWSIARLLWERIDIWAIAALFLFIMWIVDTIGLVVSVYSGYQWLVWGIIGFCLRHRRDQGHGSYEPAATSAAMRARFPNLVGAA